MIIADQYPLLIKALKKVLKLKGLSYKNLAEQIGMTESGVKKIFGSKDCSFGRLNQICNVLGVSLGDLIQERDGSDTENVSYTMEQQQYFLKNPECLNFYWKLIFERLTVEQIQESESLSDALVFQYLKKLDELKLLILETGGKVHVPKIRRIGSFGKGPLIDKIYKEWSVDFVKEVSAAHEQEDQQFIFRYVRMKNETYSEFLLAIKEVEKEFLKRAVREMSLYNNQLTHVRWVSAVDQKSFIKSVKTL